MNNRDVAGTDITVTSAEIATRLHTEGYEGSARDLSIAVGNVLSRSGWDRVGGGLYEYNVEKLIELRDQSRE